MPHFRVSANVRERGFTPTRITWICRSKSKANTSSLCQLIDPGSRRNAHLTCLTIVLTGVPNLVLHWLGSTERRGVTPPMEASVPPFEIDPDQAVRLPTCWVCRVGGMTYFGVQLPVFPSRKRSTRCRYSSVPHRPTQSESGGSHAELRAPFDLSAVFAPRAGLVVAVRVRHVRRPEPSS